MLLVMRVMLLLMMMMMLMMARMMSLRVVRCIGERRIGGEQQDGDDGEFNHDIDLFPG